MVPIVSFVCWNRAGLKARNLNELLKSTDDFELYIVDSNSEDDTWEFLKTLKDDRIKEIKRLHFNYGPPYAINYIMSKRKKGQYFFHVDSDSFVVTKDWISKFMEVMNVYPEVGAACTVGNEIFNIWARDYPFKYIERNNVGIQESGILLAGYLLCIRPELMDRLGYFNEETGRCDSDYARRIKGFTDYKMAFVPDIIIDQTQEFKCEECSINRICTVKNKNTTCFAIRNAKYQNWKFDRLTLDRQEEFFNEIKNGIRSEYCASIHDEESLKNHYYNKVWAQENFKYYINNAN